MMDKSKVKYSIRLYLSVAIMLFGLIGFTRGQELTFTAKAPKVLRAGEQFQLEFSTNRNVDDFTPPDFGEFRYLGGPSTSSSTSVSMGGGKTVRISTYTFSYYLQAPAKGGKYTINGATAKYKKQQIISNPVNIEVVSSGTSSSGQSSGKSQSQPKGGTQSASGEDIFIRLVTDKKTAYVGEQITAWIKIYTKLNISGFDQRFTGPDFVGFYQQEVEVPSFSLEREKVGNDIFYSGVLKKVILYPQKSGEIIVEPFELLVEVQKQSSRRSQSVFDEFFGPQYNRSRINLKSKPVKFTIKQLPYPRPSDFTGAVGRFSMQASANGTDVSTNDAITFKISVSGKGNLKLIDVVQSEFPPAFDVFEPIKKVQIDKANDGKSGKVNFEYTVIPRHAGSFQIPAFSLSYFDPGQKVYKSIASQEFQVNVARGNDEDSTTVLASNLSKEDIELLGSDIRYIVTTTQLRRKGHYLLGSSWFYAFYLGILILFILTLIFRKEQIKRTADIVRYRNRKAGKVAGKKLKKAKAFMKHNAREQFYEEIGRALWNYLSDKLNIQISDLSKDRAEAKLKESEVEEKAIEKFFSLVDMCEYARFAPGNADADLSKLYNEASKTINELDQKL